MFSFRGTAGAGRGERDSLFSLSPHLMERSWTYPNAGPTTSAANDAKNTQAIQGCTPSHVHGLTPNALPQQGRHLRGNRLCKYSLKKKPNNNHQSASPASISTKAAPVNVDATNMWDEDDTANFRHLYQRSRSNQTRRLRLQRLRDEGVSPVHLVQDEATGQARGNGLGENTGLTHDPLCPQKDWHPHMDVCQCALIQLVREDERSK